MANRSMHRKQLQSGDWDILDLPGLSAEHEQKLTSIGIQTTRQLFYYTQTARQRQKLSAALKVHPQHVEKWAALADLARIPGVGYQYCGLLLHAGIRSTQILAQTPLPRLHQQILKLHVATLQRKDLCPSLGDVSHWIQQAQWLASQDTKTSL